MKSFLRRAAVLIGAVAVSAGLVSVTAVPAHAEDGDSSLVQQSRDSGWPTG